MGITCVAFLLLIQTLHSLASNDSPFQLINKNTGFCLVKNSNCNSIRWTAGDRLIVLQWNKCLGAQGKSVGSDISLYECDEDSELQKWECRNNTLLALKDQELYIQLKADNTADLSNTVGPNNHLTIPGTNDGACSRTYKEMYTIGGNAAGMPCMFPFLYKGQWYSNCTTFDSSEMRFWCAVDTRYRTERWGNCPSTSKESWEVHPTTGVYYQLNTQSALTWHQAEASCRQQGASLLTVDDQHEQAYITALLGKEGITLWIGLIVDPEHGWKWSNGRPYRYMKWGSGHPLHNPGYNCAAMNPGIHYSWQSSSCNKKLGYICSSKATEETPTPASHTGYCSAPWIAYNGHCFHLNRTNITWTDAQRQCRDERGDLASIQNVEEQSFVISQLGYVSTDELWIGLNDRKMERLFDWSDHSTVRFTSWEAGKPVVSSEVKDCIIMRGEKGNWADRACEEVHGFICMKISASRPSGHEVEQNVGCKNGWRRHASYCYFTATETKTFDEAKDDCRNSDSYLADVSNGVDNAFLVSLVGVRPEKHFWLGLSNQKDIDKFVWTNAQFVRFTHWNAEMPGSLQGCVALKTGIFAGLWDVLPCTNKEKYICKHLAEGAVLTPAPPTLVPPDCETGWRRLGQKNQCFKLFKESRSEKTTWFQARDFCRALGGDLLSFHTKEDLYSLPNVYGTAWIGLSAPQPGAGYEWSDGSPLQFQHWNDGEPNNKNNVESCVDIKMKLKNKRGSWNDVHCEKLNSVLCQIRAGFTPNPLPSPVAPDYNITTDGWLEWNGNQYLFRGAFDTMEEGRSYCKEKHADLLSISSEAEAVFVWKQISLQTRTVWIGLSVDLDGSFEWLDGTPNEFQKWDEKQPEFYNNDENCAFMNHETGFWSNSPCGMDYYVSCKRSSTPLPSTTVAPKVRPTGGCPNNWEKYKSKCYRVINNKNETWDGAMTQCKAMGGNLVSIFSQDEQVFLSLKMLEAPTVNLWIGSHKSRSFSFYWTDGRPKRYTNWQRETYDDHLKWKDCGLMVFHSKSGIGKWMKKTCNDTNGYICMRKIDPSQPNSPDPTISSGYVQILNDSIKVVPQKMSWKAAKEYCRKDGASLASIRNEGTKLYFEWLRLNGKALMWLGLNKNETDGYFRYVDGFVLTVTNWDSSEPRMRSDCVSVKENGKWRTVDCNQDLNVVCMKTTDVAPTLAAHFPGKCPVDSKNQGYRSQEKIWIPYKKYCYLFPTGRSSWPEATASCMERGATLASIEDPEEQEFLSSIMLTYKDSITSFWVGLYKTHKGVWQWLDKTVIDYTNWDDGQPESGSGIYAYVDSTSGKWKTAQRWYDKAYICKTQKELQTVKVTDASLVQEDSQSRGHKVLVPMLIVTAVVVAVVVIFFLLKKSGVRLVILEKSTTIDNPLFFNTE